jgi:integrase
MRGSLKQRYKGTWSIILDLGYQTDPTTGKSKRRQKWITVKGTKRDAEARLNTLLHDIHKQQFVEPSKRSVGDWLDEWLAKVIKPAKRLRTYETYRSVIERYLKPNLGEIPLQQLKAIDLEQYYVRVRKQPDNQGRNSDVRGLSVASVEQHHAIIHGALQAALFDDLVMRNVAKLVKAKPRRPEGQGEALLHCWESHEAKSFLATAKEAGPQQAAFYALAVDSGMRKAELCGLKWADVDFPAATVSVRQQLVKPGQEPIFGPPKNGKIRVIDLGTETLTLLRKHLAHQAEMKMANRTRYRDHGLVFAKEWPDMQRQRDSVGDPLQINNLGQREFAQLIKAAGVRKIKFHGLRHTCATLLLQAGVPAKVVQERLGHKRIEITLNIYSHVLPSMQQDAAARLGAILHG